MVVCIRPIGRILKDPKTENNLAIRARPILTVFINYLKINFMFEPTLAKFLLHQANFNCRKWAIF